MNQTDYFERLGAPLRNNRWSWGAVRPTDGAVFVRVWKDQLMMEEHSGRPVGRLTRHAAYIGRTNHPGYRERLKHVDLIRNGVPCYLILCEAVDPKESPRKIRQFDTDQVFRGGQVKEIEGDSWVEVLDRVPIEQITP